MIAVVFALMQLQGVVEARDSLALRAARSVLVGDLEAGLPRLPFEPWLRRTVGDGAQMTWEVNDCGEQTGDPAIDRGRDLPVCAEVEVLFSGGRRLNVVLAVGTVQRGVGRRPAVYSIGLTTPGGAPEWRGLRSLSEIPAAIRSPPPAPAR